MRADRLEPKWYAVESGCLTSFRRELKGLPVYRADLNPPVMNAEHGKAAGLDHAGRGHPNRKAGRQEQRWDDRRSQGRFVTSRICPRRSGLERREKFVEPLQLGTAIDKRHLSLSAPKTVAQRSTVTTATTQYCQVVREDYVVSYDTSCSIELRVSPEGTGLRQIRAL